MTVEDDLRSALSRVADNVRPPLPDPEGQVAQARRVRRRRRVAAAGTLVAALIAVGLPRTGVLHSEHEPANHHYGPVRLGDVHSYDTLTPGRYEAQFGGAPGADPMVVVEVPPGFSSNGWLYDGVGDGARSSAGGKTHRQLAFWTVATVNTSPCLGADHWVSAGSSAPDLVAALQSVPGLRLGAPVPVTLDGYQGLRLQVAPVAREIWDSCRMGQFNLWRDSTGSLMYLERFQRWVEDLWIIDIEGQRVVMSAEHHVGVHAAQVAELERIVRSAEFQQP